MNAPDFAKRIDAILDLLQQNTSLQVVGEFLKSKQLHHSAGSWEDLRNKRIIPYIQDYTLSENDLIHLLRSSEEYGKQHVFLWTFDPTQANDILHRDRIAAELTSLGCADVLANPLILDQPTELSIADVRWRNDGIDNALIIKLVSTRISQKLKTTAEEDGYLIKKYKIEKERAVHVVRVHRDGLLEIRIAANDSSSKYSTELQTIIHKIYNLIIPYKINFDNFYTLGDLSNLKKIIAVDHFKHSDIIRTVACTLRNESGTIIRAATNQESNLSEDNGATESIAAFVGLDGYCDSSNFWFKELEHGPSKQIHVMLSGQLNEFSIQGQCSPSDYEYALDKIRLLNR